MSDDYDSHQRIGARCTRIRSFTSRPSEVTETREKPKGSAYKKSAGVAKCDTCRANCFIDSMIGGVCRDCLMQGVK